MSNDGLERSSGGWVARLIGGSNVSCCCADDKPKLWPGSGWSLANKFAAGGYAAKPASGSGRLRAADAGQPLRVPGTRILARLRIARGLPPGFRTLGCASRARTYVGSPNPSHAALAARPFLCCPTGLYYGAKAMPLAGGEAPAEAHHRIAGGREG